MKPSATIIQKTKSTNSVNNVFNKCYAIYTSQKGILQALVNKEDKKNGQIWLTGRTNTILRFDAQSLKPIRSFKVRYAIENIQFGFQKIEILSIFLLSYCIKFQRT